MLIEEIKQVRLTMDHHEAYALWCLLDEVDDANDISLPESIRKLTSTLRGMLEARKSPAQQSLK